MKRLIALFAALVLGGLALGPAGTASLAQDGVLEACEAGKEEIRASDLPQVVEPGECPTLGRRISDGGVAAFVPPPGRTVYAEVLTTSGAQELTVGRRPDGTVEIDRGDDEEPGMPGGPGRAVDREGCRSYAYDDLDRRVDEAFVYEFNVFTTPRNLSRLQVRNAIRRAATNVFETRNNCRMGDRVPAAARFGGRTGAPAQAGDGRCGLLDDGRSVVAFGDLKDGVLAVACTNARGRPSYDQVTSADVKINRDDYRWTTTPGVRTCSGEYDVEGIVTHEWGHVFGLGHVTEDASPDLTMSPNINGPCQDSERSLGRGDVLGLDGKYE